VKDITTVLLLYCNQCYKIKCYGPPAETNDLLCERLTFSTFPATRPHAVWSTDRLRMTSWSYASLPGTITDWVDQGQKWQWAWFSLVMVWTMVLRKEKPKNLWSVLPGLLTFIGQQLYNAKYRAVRNPNPSFSFPRWEYHECQTLCTCSLYCRPVLDSLLHNQSTSVAEPSLISWAGC